MMALTIVLCATPRNLPFKTFHFGRNFLQRGTNNKFLARTNNDSQRWMSRCCWVHNKHMAGTYFKTHKIRWPLKRQRNIAHV